MMVEMDGRVDLNGLRGECTMDALYVNKGAVSGC